MSEKCDDCGGSGRKSVEATSSGGTVEIKCPTCNGSGKKPKSQTESGSKSRYFIINY